MANEIRVISPMINAGLQANIDQGTQNRPLEPAQPSVIAERIRLTVEEIHTAGGKIIGMLSVGAALHEQTFTERQTLGTAGHKSADNGLTHGFIIAVMPEHLD